MNLNELIDTAIKHGACENVINKLRTYNTFEDAAKDEKAPYYVFWYAEKVINGRWEECEYVILMSVEYSYYYAKDVIKSRWVEAEPIIFSDEAYKTSYCNYFNIKD